MGRTPCGSQKGGGSIIMADSSSSEPAAPEEVVPYEPVWGKSPLASEAVLQVLELMRLLEREMELRLPGVSWMKEAREDAERTRPAVL